MDYMEAKKLLKEKLKNRTIINHCVAVSKFAYKLARKIKRNGYNVDPEKVRIAALLHDIGRCVNHKGHEFEGAKILRRLGEYDIARIIERHGIAKEEAEELGIKGEFEPQTLEERIVAYSDGRFDGDQMVTLKERFKLILKRSDDYRKRLIEKAKKRSFENEKFIMKLLETKVNLIVFDMDGVLLDSKKAYIAAIKSGIKTFGYNLKSKDIESKLGSTLEDVLENLGIKQNGIIDVILRYLENKKVKGMIKLNPEIKILEKLKTKRKICLLTNSQKEFVEFYLKDYAKLFDRIITADDKFNFKEDGLKYLIKKFNATPKETAYIGDMPRDVEVAKNIGCVSIAIYNKFSWIYPNKEKIENAKPDFIIKNLAELLTLFG